MAKRTPPTQSPKDNADVQPSSRPDPVQLPASWTTAGRTPPNAASVTADVLVLLLARDDGWLRAVPHPLDNVVYFKWKFTHGRWSGHYVMSRVESNQVSLGLELLLDKLQRVDEGIKRPTLDSYFSDL